MNATPQPDKFQTVQFPILALKDARIPVKDPLSNGSIRFVYGKYLTDEQCQEKRDQLAAFARVMLQAVREMN